MIVETTSCPGSSKRMFYGIKSNGRAFFSNNSETKKTYYFSLDVNEQLGNEDKYRYEAEIFIATLNEGEDKGNEYLVSISKGEQYTELFNFNNGEIHQIQSLKLLGYKMLNIRSSALSFSLNKKYYVLYAFKSNNGLIIERLYFKDKNLTEIRLEKKSYNKTDNKGEVLVVL